MLLKRIAAFCAVMLSIVCHAQKGDTLHRYLDEAYEFTSAKKMVYRAKAFKEQESWVLHAFYPNGELMFIARYKNKKLLQRNGLFTFFYPGGQKQAEGKFVNNLREKEWQWWYPNGNLKDSGSMKLDHFAGTWHTWYPSGQLKSISNFSLLPSYQLTFVGGGSVNRSLLNGSYASWYESGAIESKGNYLNGIMQGEWEWYHANGKQSTREWYDGQGKVTEMKCYDSSGIYQGDFCSLQKPAVLKGLGYFKEYFFTFFSWPPEAEKQKKKGTVWVTMTIATDGTIKSLQVKGTSEVLARSVHKFIKNLPEWEPALSHNRLVEWKEEIQVDYERKPNLKPWEPYMYEAPEPHHRAMWED